MNAMPQIARSLIITVAAASVLGWSLTANSVTANSLCNQLDQQNLQGALTMLPGKDKAWAVLINSKLHANQLGCSLVTLSTDHPL